VKGKDHRFSLLLVRGFWQNEPSVLSVCLGKLYGREGKKKSQEEKKIDSRATLMQSEYFRRRREGKE